MIKILKEGKKTITREIPIYKVICDDCKCEFEYGHEDIIVKSKTFGNHIENFEVIPCPCCGKLIQLKTKDISRKEKIEEPIKSKEDFSDLSFIDLIDKLFDLTKK